MSGEVREFTVYFDPETEAINDRESGIQIALDVLEKRPLLTKLNALADEWEARAERHGKLTTAGSSLDDYNAGIGSALERAASDLRSALANLDPKGETE